MKVIVVQICNVNSSGKNRTIDNKKTGVQDDQHNDDDVIALQSPR
jgi:hypothetical protein